MRYLPHTEADIARMLRVIGVDSVEELFSDIPERLRFRGPLPLAAGLSEPEVLDLLDELGGKNRPHNRNNGQLVFAGAGVYHHHIPAAVDALSMRGEFATAYTPYQPELSQGTLMAIFEFQTLVCELFGTEYANASMYDGATATAEAMLMAARLTRRWRIVVSGGVHPEYLATCRTYDAGIAEHEIVLIPLDAEGRTDQQALASALGDDVACLIVQAPNCLGVIEDIAPLAAAAHSAGALLVAVNAEPLSLALLRPPGDAGADIVVGDGSGLATLPSLGGPGVGLMGASGKKALRALPGRLVGETVDSAGRVGYVLTLSTREQHIRRERATSNICTNHGLYALRFAIHLSLLGKGGLERLARTNLAKAHYAKRRLGSIDGYGLLSAGPSFNEFALRTPRSAEAIVDACAADGVVPGVALARLRPEAGAFAAAIDPERVLLVSVTEIHRREDIDRLAVALSEHKE